jgi:hypothetical protein
MLRLALKRIRGESTDFAASATDWAILGEKRKGSHSAGFLCGKLEKAAYAAEKGILLSSFEEKKFDWIDKQEFLLLHRKVIGKMSVTRQSYSDLNRIQNERCFRETSFSE